MSKHSVILQENEFRLFEVIQRIDIDTSAKNIFIESLINQLEGWINSRTCSAKEIMQLPPQERQKILSLQFQEAELWYRENPDMIIPDVDEPIHY